MKNKQWKRVGWLMSLSLILGLSSCTDGAKKSSVLDAQTIVGSIEMVNGDSVWVCRPSALTDTVTLPLSYLAEELQITKLDNRDEALVPVNRVIVSDNYLLVYGHSQTPFKLFDKSGKFICSVGSFGQGPGEYQNVYDAQIDEAGGRVYLLPWSARAILAYDMKGQLVQRVPLYYPVPKGVFRANTKDFLLSVFLLPFNPLPSVAWTQKLNGEVVDTVPARHLTVNPDFSNEVFSQKNGPDFDASLFLFWGRRPDSLYHYTPGRLVSRFTVDFGKKDIPIHSYQELPHHFVGDMSVEKQLDESTFTTEPPVYFIMDKQSLKGAYYKVVNDYLGNMPISGFQYSCSNGYYIANMEPMALKESLSDYLEKNKDVSTKDRERLQKLVDSIHENDNNYILYAKLK
ncbi:MAG: 6-bladed beta-propeller [Bacteroides sp.]|nr:6-bladed beta-propeller [Bacteroides sp.]